MNRCRCSDESAAKRHRNAPLLVSGYESSLAREPVLRKLLGVSNCRFFGIEVAQGAIRRLRVEPNLRKNDLGCEFALVGRARRAIGLIASQCKDSLHCIEKCDGRRDRSTACAHVIAFNIHTSDITTGTLPRGPKPAIRCIRFTLPRECDPERFEWGR